MLNKKFAIIPALVALGVFAMHIDRVSAGPDGGGKNGDDQGDDHGDGGDGGKNGGDGGDGGKNGGDGGDGADNGDDDGRTDLNNTNTRVPNRFLSRWAHQQRLRHRCRQAAQTDYAGRCGPIRIVTPEPVYVDTPVRKQRRKARRVVVVQEQQVDAGGYYARPVVRYVAQPSRAALLQAQKRARRDARDQVVEGGYAYEEREVVVRAKTRKHRRARHVYLPGYDAGVVVHYGPLVEKNGGY